MDTSTDKKEHTSPGKNSHSIFFHFCLGIRCLAHTRQTAAKEREGCLVWLANEREQKEKKENRIDEKD